jgi:hypothetical protein
MDSSRSSRQRAPKGASAVAERLRKARQGEREETAIPVKDNVLDEVDEDEYEQLVEARKARGQFVLDDDQGDDDDDDDEQGDGYEDDGEEFWDTSNDKSSKTGTKRKARGMLRERERASGVVHCLVSDINYALACACTTWLYPGASSGSSLTKRLRTIPKKSDATQITNIMARRVAAAAEATRATVWPTHTGANTTI